MSEHVTVEALAAYVDGKLEKGLRDQAESHLSRCRECREALADIVAIAGSRSRVPAEFLARALKGAAATAPRGAKAALGRGLSLRPAFGIAAVFLVAIVIAYLFIGRERSRSAAGGESGKRIDAFPSEVEPRPARVGAPTTVPAKKAAPAALARDENEGAAAGKGAISRERRRGTAGSVEKTSGRDAGGPAADEMKAPPPGPPAVIGGILAAEAKDKEEAALPAVDAEAAHSVTSRAQRLEESALPAADAPLRAKAGVPSGKGRYRSPANGAGTAAETAERVRGLFLAATGRAAAPRTLPAPAPAPRPGVGLSGDVAAEDLLDPGALADWDWLPEGWALELTISVDGRVSGLRLLGSWEPAAAARARAAASALMFSPATRGTRRAVLSRLPAN